MLESLVMELRQLQYFVTVAEEANFTRAAAKLHVAQPGVSAQIRRLERELGQELLDRSARVVRLTEAGAAVLPYARAALQAVDGARLVVDELTGLVRGHVAIGTVTSHTVDLAALLAQFHHDHPAVEMTLTENNSDQLIDALRGGRLDAAIIALGATPPPDLELHIVTDEPIAAAVSHGDELAKRSTIPLNALRGRRVLPPHRLRSQHPRGARAAGRAGAGRGDRPRLRRPGAGRPAPAHYHPASLARVSGLRLADRRPDQPRRPSAGRTSSANAQHRMINTGCPAAYPPRNAP